MLSYLLVVELRRTQIVIHALLKCQQENLYHEQYFFFSSRRRHTRWPRDWSSHVCSSDLDFTVPPNEQSGIFVGTREWDVPSRNHAAALLLARELSQKSGESVTVFNLNGRKGARLLSELKFRSEERRVGKECKSQRLGEHY